MSIQMKTGKTLWKFNLDRHAAGFGELEQKERSGLITRRIDLSRGSLQWEKVKIGGCRLRIWTRIGR